jgi:hypothetical protein
MAIGFWSGLLWQNAPRWAARTDRATLLKSIGRMWAADVALSNLVPGERVVTGRIPSTTEFPLPYCSIMEAGGNRRQRTNVNQYDLVPVTFSVWLPAAHLALGESIDAAISDCYANKDWRYKYGRVMDVLDDGPAAKNQVQRAEYQCWEVVKVMSLIVQRTRADRYTAFNGVA